MEAVADFIFLGSKITADGDCSHEKKKQTPISRPLLKISIMIFNALQIYFTSS